MAMTIIDQQTIELRVYLHCQECAKPIVKLLKAIEGVLKVETDFGEHKVIVLGEKDVNPQELVKKLRRRFNNKQVEIISLILTDTDNTSEVINTTIEPKIIRVVLSIYIHCENCGKRIVQGIQKMAGVQKVDVNAKDLQVIVQGEFEANKLVEHVEKKMGKYAAIVEIENVSENIKEHCETEDEHDCPFDGLTPHPLNYFCASEMFSDENSEACIIM